MKQSLNILAAVFFAGCVVCAENGPANRVSVGLVPAQQANFFIIPSPWDDGFLEYWYPEEGFEVPLVQAEGVPEDQIRPVITVPRFDASPVIDGNLDDPVWEKASLISGFALMNAREIVEAENQTQLWLGYDDERFYLAFKTAVTAVNPCPPREDNYYINEQLQVMLAPRDVDTPGYYQLILDPDHVALDGFGFDNQWNGNADYASRLEDDVWSGEMSITFEALKTAVPGAGDEWKANFCRSLAWMKHTAWSHHGYSLHDKSNYGTLRFTRKRQAVRVMAMSSNEPSPEVLDAAGKPWAVKRQGYGEGTTVWSIDDPDSEAPLWRQVVVTADERPRAYTWWSCQDGNSIHYMFAVEPGVVFEGKALRTSPDRVECTFELRNKTDHRVEAKNLGVCMMLGAMPGFNEMGSDTYRIAVGGKEAPISDGLERKYWDIKDGVSYGDRFKDAVLPVSDLPMVARKHRELDRYIAVWWDTPSRGSANPQHPCMHIDPVFPACEAGKTVAIKGGVLFHDGDWDSLVARVKRGLGRKQ